MGTLAGAPAYVIPAMTDTLLGAKALCKLGNIVLVDDQKIICVGSDASTRALTEGSEVKGSFTTSFTSSWMSLRPSPTPP